ncbi:MAG TPA: hypothetical protein VIZ18_19600 [Ktedonobacteraceae bacterium]
MTTNSLAKKLQMKAGQRAVICNPPAGYLERLNPLPEGVELVEAPEGQCDFVQVFVKNMEDLQKFLPIGLQVVKHDALLWIAYPKGGAKAGTDLNRDILWNAVSQHNLSGVTLVSLDEIWSAMRFRPSERVGQ